jgi:hypothetical protein
MEEKFCFLGIVSTDTRKWIFGIHISWHPRLHFKGFISSPFMHIYGPAAWGQSSLCIVRHECDINGSSPLKMTTKVLLNWWKENKGRFYLHFIKGSSRESFEI